MMRCLLLKWANQYVLFEMDGFGRMDWILIVNHCRDGIVSFQFMIDETNDGDLAKM